MLSWFRRQRLVAALMILANPALVGSWVAAYHPCPVSDGAEWRRAAEAQVVVASVSEHAGHEGMEMEAVPAEGTGLQADHPAGHDHQQNDGHCSCIGQCLTAGAALPAVAGRESRVAVEITHDTTPNTQYSLVLPSSDPLQHLPPSTAPPIA